MLVLRRDAVEHDHFRVPTAVPIVGLGVSIALLTQIEAEVWARAGLLVGLGAALWALNLALVRRERRAAA